MITVCYNAEKTIERTVESVISQSYPNFEYVIVDGGSRDSTLDIIEKYSLNISSLISEPDNGIYDAMNKGVQISTGMYVIFMNSGDIFVNSNVLLNLFSNIHDFPDVIYGNTVLLYSYGKFLVKAKSLSELNRHMIFCHQSSLVKREIIANHPFDSHFKIAADYGLFYNLYAQGKIFVYVDLPISVYEAEDGLSSSTPFLLYKEYSLINGCSYLVDKVYLAFCVFIDFMLKMILSKKKYYELMIVRKKRKNVMPYEL